MRGTGSALFIGILPMVASEIDGLPVPGEPRAAG
jgi:hypothetical protein